MLLLCLFNDLCLVWHMSDIIYHTGLYKYPLSPFLNVLDSAATSNRLREKKKKKNNNLLLQAKKTKAKGKEPIKMS